MAMTLQRILSENLAGALVLEVPQGESVLTGSAAALAKETKAVVNELSHDALAYWRAKASGKLLAVRFKKHAEDAIVTMVEVDSRLDDDAPLDATHKAFLDEQADDANTEHQKDADRIAKGARIKIAPTEIEYVRCEGVGHLNQVSTRIAKAKPNPEAPENLAFRVKDDDGTTKDFAGDAALIDWIKTKSALPGQSNLSRCVSAMSRGGKYTLKHDGKDVLHASKGRPGDAGSCTVFWVQEAKARVRLVGFGRHRTNTEYDVYWSELFGGNGARALGARVVLG